MIASAHVAAGFVAGMVAARITERRVHRIAAAFGLGLLSHVALDAVPHADYWQLPPSTVVKVVFCEIVLVSTIAALILRRRLTPDWPEYLLSGLAGSVILDAKFTARILLPQGPARSVEHFGDYLHRFFHAAYLSHPLPGTVAEITTTILLLALLTRFPRKT